ncbi:unnamed protein product, partial [marine sediment metagenome]
MVAQWTTIETTQKRAAQNVGKLHTAYESASPEALHLP